jgi:hypothetical protein
MAAEAETRTGYDIGALKIEALRQEISRYALALAISLAEQRQAGWINPEDDERLRAWHHAELERLGLL